MLRCGATQCSSACVERPRHTWPTFGARPCASHAHWRLAKVGSGIVLCLLFELLETTRKPAILTPTTVASSLCHSTGPVIALAKNRNNNGRKKKKEKKKKKTAAVRQACACHVIIGGSLRRRCEGPALRGSGKWLARLPQLPLSGDLPPSFLARLWWKGKKGGRE